MTDPRNPAQHRGQLHSAAGGPVMAERGVLCGQAPDRCPVRDRATTSRLYVQIAPALPITL
jgi:hypothetical protein